MVLVPGITGTELRRRDAGEVEWGRGWNLISPHDGGYTLARPLSDPLNGPASDVEAGSVLEAVRLGPIRKEVYGPIFDLLEAHGYARGDLSSPNAENDFYAFGYDWRGDNVYAAQLLRERLEALAAERGGNLAVDLICQSNGAHICRYLLKYGGVSLSEAESGRGAALGFRIRKLILVGSSNGGSLRVLREIHRGRRYLPLIGRSLKPEVLFSFPSLFQDLVAHHEAPFIDPRGESLALDLFEPESWLEQGWSVFREEPRRRMARRPDLFGDEPARLAYLRAALDRARRLHALLLQDVPDFPETRYYSVQNTMAPTPHRAVVGAGEDRLLFTGDSRLEELLLEEDAVSRPGDGHATVDSQNALSPQEREAMALPKASVPGGHFELILEPATLQSLLEFLLD
ncbi:MAG: hypothetical protein AAF725_10905 [Acidobacteriota bacterium]